MSSLLNSLGTFATIAVILSIAAVVAAFIFIVPQKKREKLNLAGRIAHDVVNFRFLITEKICQAAYIFFTVFLILAGFFLLFVSVPINYYGDRKWLGGYGLLLMILGPIVVRLIFEFLMMALLLVKNVISINSKLRAPGEPSDDAERFGDSSDVDELRQLIRNRVANRAQKPTFTQSYPQSGAGAAAPEDKPSHGYCPHCGTPLDADGKCPNCD